MIINRLYLVVRYSTTCSYSFLFSDVPMWLKTLRLHKYAYLFQQMTYEEMMNLTEEWLETQVHFIIRREHILSPAAGIQVILFFCQLLNRMNYGIVSLSNVIMSSTKSTLLRLIFFTRLLGLVV